MKKSKIIRDKKGFEMLWSTWIAMVLAFILLIFLILFFTNTGKGFLDNAKTYFSSSNVDSIVKSCNLLSSGGEEYSFCCDKKETIYLVNRKKIIGSFSCGELINQEFINDKIDRRIKCEGVVC